MAEVIGTASAITTFVTLAFQSSVSLYQTVRSLQSRDKVVRELRNELEDLLGVLQALKESVGNLDVDLAALEQPLTRCSNACREFNTLIMECTQHSTEERGSKRDWLKIKYMGEDISGFKNMLAAYKSTITIALAYANLRTTQATNSVLKEYKDLIEDTKCDLESHLHDIRARLESALSQDLVASGIDTVELRRMEEEKDSTQKSLDICERFLTLIDQSRTSLLGVLGFASEQSDQTPSSVAPNLSWLINAEGLNSTQKEVTSWKLRLLQHLFGIGKNIQGPRLDSPRSNNGQTSEQQAFQEEFSGTESLLEFCKQAEEEANHPGTHKFEDVSTGDNSRQVIATTLKDLISAKRIKSGHKSFQALGQMSNESIQTVFRRPEPSSAYTYDRRSEREGGLETT